ncbi:MAG: SDR family oxidoreductase [Bacteroidales bacterium]|nr:SDR family oxidoreductase [Bacteroidales bacterium]
MKRFVNKTALVTGGAAGIGRATVERLVKEGAKVIIADCNIEAAQKFAQSLRDNEYKVDAIRYDAAKEVSALKAVDRAIEVFGGIDILINNVGGSDLSKDLDVEELDTNYFNEVFHINLLSMIHTTRAAIPVMKSSGGGTIVNVASIGGLLGDFRGTLYGLSKAGVINLTRYTATQFGQYKIRCNSVSPGLVLTSAATSNLSESAQNLFLKYNALPYLGYAFDIAAVITFLASDDARYITGQNIVADGGLTCHNPTVKEIKE